MDASGPWASVYVSCAWIRRLITVLFRPSKSPRLDVIMHGMGAVVPTVSVVAREFFHYRLQIMASLLQRSCSSRGAGGEGEGRLGQFETAF